MSGLIQRRMTGRIEGEFVVFLIGMRLNRWWKIHRWLFAARAMPRMLKELEAQPELGYLGGEAWFGRTTVMVQYWRSAKHLMDYARAREAAHLPAWQAFNKSIGSSGDLGVWHETFRVQPGQYETVYVNMPPFGLGRVAQLVEATGRHATAAGRLGAGAPAGEGARVNDATAA